MELLVGITEYKVSERMFTGLCSNFLRDIPINSTVPIWIKKGTLTFPTNNPLILVATGTGISSFRATIQANPQQKIILFYGFRVEKADDYYLSELQSSQITLYTAISSKNQYIQNLITSEKQTLKHLIKQEKA